MLKLLRLILLGVALVVGAAFAYINPSLVQVDFYLATLELQLGMLILLLLGVGMVLGMLASLLFLIKAKQENADLRRKAKLATQEVNNLRAMPLKDR